MGLDGERGVTNPSKEIPCLPKGYWHLTQQGYETYLDNRFGMDLFTPPHRWERFVVKLTFEKAGKGEQHGNGFYVNIPNASFDVILTAGHNLVDKPGQYCSNIRIVKDPKEGKDIPVTSDMIRVCQRYLDEPDQTNEIYDYGIILLERRPSNRFRGFGFSLMLGLAPQLNHGAAFKKDEKDILHDSLVYVSGYMPNDQPGRDPPRRSEGKCIRAALHQLHYDADTQQGMSGGPVWMGSRGVETVVAIHNYGGGKEGSRNRGSRLNLNVWRDIFYWLDVGWYGVSLQYRKPRAEYSMHLHLPQESDRHGGDNSNEARVRVGRPGRVETRFDIMPVAAKPSAKESDATFGFLLRPKGPNSETAEPTSAASPWVRWDPIRSEVSRASRFDGQCEVRIPRLIIQPGKPFEIQARYGKGWKQVRMEMGFLDKDDFDIMDNNPRHFEDTWEISFVPVTPERFFELQ